MIYHFVTYDLPVVSYDPPNLLVAICPLKTLLSAPRSVLACFWFWELCYLWSTYLLLMIYQNAPFCRMVFGAIFMIYLFAVYDLPLFLSFLSFLFWLVFSLFFLFWFRFPLLFSPFFLPASFVFLVFWCWCSGLTRLSQSNKRKQGRRTSKRERKRK